MNGLMKLITVWVRENILSINWDDSMEMKKIQTAYEAWLLKRLVYQEKWRQYAENRGISDSERIEILRKQVDEIIRELIFYKVLVCQLEDQLRERRDSFQGSNPRDALSLLN